MPCTWPVWFKPHQPVWTAKPKHPCLSKELIIAKHCLARLQKSQNKLKITSNFGLSWIFLGEGVWWFWVTSSGAQGIILGSAFRGYSWKSSGSYGVPLMLRSSACKAISLSIVLSLHPGPWHFFLQLPFCQHLGNQTTICVIISCSLFSFKSGFLLEPDL